MRTNTLALVVFGFAVMVSACDQLERKPTRSETPRDKSNFLKISFQTSNPSLKGFYSVEFNSGELVSCRVLRASDSDGEIKVDEIEMAFERLPKLYPDQLTENSTLYFPYVEQPEKKSSLGSLSLTLKRYDEILNLKHFDSFNKDQDRSKCVVEYRTDHGKLSGSYVCPVMAQLDDETLDVRGQFSCVLTR